MEWLVGIGAFVAWWVVVGVAAVVLTIMSIVAADKIEHYLVVSDRRSFLVWMLCLSICPAIGFFGNWMIWGFFLPEGLYTPARLGWLAAGIVFVGVGALIVTRPGNRDEERAGELPTLAGAVLADLLCCAALIWHFEPIAAFMRGSGAG